MRKIFLMGALVLGFAAIGSLMPSRAEAMTITTPAAVQQAINGNSALEQVRYVCRRVWRCSWRGCGWRRSCHWRPRHRWYGHHYRSYPRYYGYRYRPHYRYRYY